MNNRIVGEFEEQRSGHKPLRESRATLDAVGSRREEDTLLQATYQRAIAVGRKRVFSGQGQRRSDAKKGDEQPSAASKMEPIYGYNNYTSAQQDEGMSQESPRDGVADRQGSLKGEAGVEVESDGGADPQIVSANDLQYQLDLDDLKQGRNSQFENRYIQRKHPGASAVHISQTERASEADQSEPGAHRESDGDWADAGRRFLKEEARQGTGERSEYVDQRDETDECADAEKEREAAKRTTGSMPQHQLTGGESRPDVKAEELPRQERRAPMPRSGSRRPSTRFGAESTGYCEPTIEKAVQCIQILPAERPKPQYVYITDHQGRLIEIEHGHLDSLRAATPAAVTKRAAKSGTARGGSNDREADDEDDHSQNETKSQITQFTDNTGTNNPSQQFQMNQVRAFQNMNAELHSQPNMSDKSPPAGTSGQTAEEGGSHHLKRGPTAYQNQDAEQTFAPIANDSLGPGANESQEAPNVASTEAILESRAMPLENHLKKLKGSTASVAGRSRLAANKLSELIDADQEAQEESTKKAGGQRERPWLTFNNNVFDIVARQEAREKQRTTSFTQSQKSCEMQSSGLLKEATIASRLKKQPINQGTVPSSGVTRSKKAADLINVERFGVLANTRPKSSQIGRGGTTGQQRSKMMTAQRNNMKSTREDSAAYPQARGSLLRSTNQLSSAGASVLSPLDPAMDSNNGSALLRKRREQGLGTGNSSSNPRKPVASYNQAALPLGSRKLAQAQSPTVAEAPYQPGVAEEHCAAETRIRAAYKGQYGPYAGRSHSRKVNQDGLGDNLANPSIIPQDQARRASMTRHQSQAADASRERCRETDDDNSNYGTIEKGPQDQKPPTMSEEDMRKEMVAAFQKIRLDVYSDILRIKKPQTQAFVAAQLLCRLVCAFRGGAQRQVTDTKFPDWNQIQEFVHKKPNVIKFNQEITQLIQHMILSKDYLMQVKSEQLKNHLSKMAKIQVQYFAGKTKSQVLRQFQTNKNFSTIVNLCYCIVRYVLFQAGKGHLLNLTAEPTGYGSQSSASSLRRADGGSEGERASSLNSGHSAPGQRSSSKPALSSKNSVAGSNLHRAGSGRVLGTRGKNQVAAQSRNGNGALASSAEAHSTGATAPSGSYHQPGRGLTRKRSPRLPQKELFQATINRLSTPKQHQGTSKSQTAGASTSATAQAAVQKSAEQPRKRVAYMRPQEYEDEVHRRLCQATLDHMNQANQAGSSWTAAAPGRQTVKHRATGQPQRSQLSRSQRPTGGAARDKYSTAGRKKVTEPAHGSQHARTPAKGEDRQRVSKTRPYLDQVSRSYLQRRTSPHEAYQQPKDPQPVHLKASYQSRGDDLTSSSVQNSWVQLVTGQAQSDLAGSNGHLAASASKQAQYQHQRLQADCDGLQASTPNERDSDARGSSPQFSQKKSRKLYEILLQQQRRKSNSKYEKLTLSSVSKKKKGGNAAAEFSGRKATAPLVQTFAASTPGLASTLYNSNVFSTQKSKQGKENHIVAKIGEQNSTSNVRKHDALVAALAGQGQRADTITKEPGRSLLSPHQSKAVAEKSFLLHRPSASSIRSPKALLHTRNKRGPNTAAPTAMNQTLPVQANNEVEIEKNRPIGSEAATIQPESVVAEPPVPSSQQKTRKTRLERSQSKSGNRRDRHHRRRAAGDIQEGIQQKVDTPDRERNFAQEYFNNAAGGGRDEQLRQFLEIENKCGSFHNEQLEPRAIEGTETSDARPSQTVSAVTTQREDMLQSGSPSRILLIGREQKISSRGTSPQLGGEEGQNILQDAAGDESDQVRHVSVVEDRDLARADSPQQAEHQDDSGISHMSSILQQIQSEAPHPASQPAQPDHHSSFAPQEDIADDEPLDEVAEGSRRHTDTDIFVEEQAKEGSPIPSRASPSCNVPEGKSPLNFKRECKDSDDLSVLSGVGAPLDAGEGPAVVPQSTSRESGRISELPESRSAGSREAKKEELGLDSESLLSEEQNYDSAVKTLHKPSPAGVHEYKTTERSHKAAGSPSSNRVEDCVAYDPFEEAKRIAAMIKAECLGEILKEEQIVLERRPELDDSTQERVPSRSRCSPPNELSARHLLQKERLRSGEGVPQREAQVLQRTSLPDEGRVSHGNQDSEQRQSLPLPAAIMEQNHSHRVIEQSRSDSTWTADTPYRPALAHPRRNSVLSSSDRRTPDTSRHDLQVQTHFAQSSSQRRPYANEATNIVKRELGIGSHLPSEPPTAGQHFQTFLQYCDQAAGHQTANAADLSQRLSTQETPHRSQQYSRKQRTSELETPSCPRSRFDEVIGRQGDVQRVDIGGDDNMLASARVVEEEGDEATGSVESEGETSEEVHETQEECRQTEQDMETQRAKVREDAEGQSGKDDAAYKSKSAASSGEDGYYMQELVSPFRQLRLSALGSAGAVCEPDSPEYNKQIESTKWLINPVQVRRKPTGEDEDVRGSYFDVDEEQDKHVVSGRSSSPDSYRVGPLQQATNPYLHPAFSASGLTLERRVSSPVISPGKLKAQVSQSRVGIMEQILATQLEIEENSPSRVDAGSHNINREMIQRLKERRLLQRSKSREGPQGSISTGVDQTVPPSDTVAGMKTPTDTHDLIRDIQQRLLSRQSQQ